MRGVIRIKRYFRILSYANLVYYVKDEVSESKLKSLEALLLRGHAQGVRLGAFLFRRAENAGNFVSSREECFEDGFAEVLLADDGDFHDDSPLGRDEAQMCS